MTFMLQLSIMKSLFFVLCALLAAGLPTDPQAEQFSHVKNETFPIVGLANITRVGKSDIKGRNLSPALGISFADPSLIWGDGSWHAYATSSNGKKVPVATSSDAISWSSTDNDALPNIGVWVDPDDQAIWAPDVQKNVSLLSSQYSEHV
jgi:hypothetical protein